MVWFLLERLKILHFPFWDCALKFSKEKASVTAPEFEDAVTQSCSFPLLRIQLWQLPLMLIDAIFV